MQSEEALNIFFDTVMEETDRLTKFNISRAETGVSFIVNSEFDGRIMNISVKLWQ